MDAMVIARREIHDGELAARVARGIARIADELAHVIGLPLHENSPRTVDAADARELAVAWAHERVPAHASHARLECAREERVEARERGARRDGRLFEIDAVSVAVRARDPTRHQR